MLRIRVLLLVIPTALALGCPADLASDEKGGEGGAGGDGGEGEGEPALAIPGASVSASPALPLPADGASPVRVTVVLRPGDDVDAPIADRRVSLTFDPAGPDAVVDARSDAAGVASFDVVSSIAGTFAIEASVDDTVVGSVDVSFDACRSFADAFVVDAWPTALSRCVGCHNEFGFAPSLGARFVLPLPGDEDFGAKGVAAVQAMLARSAEDGLDLDVATLTEEQKAALQLEEQETSIPLLLANPIFGDITGHTGGVVLSPDETAEIARFRVFVQRLQKGADTCADQPQEDLLNGVGLLSPKQTLTKAAMTLTGAPPAPAASSSTTDEAALALALDTLLDDPRVERRMRDAFNDWLLTDASLRDQLGSLGPSFPDRFFFERLRSEGARGGNSCDDANRACCRVPEDPRNLDEDTSNDVPPKPQNVRCEEKRFQARAAAHSDALAILGRIWREDRSARELVTGNYTMVNPAYARVLGLVENNGRTFKDGVTEAFNDDVSDDATELRAVRTIDTDRNNISAENAGLNAWPHQGILSTQAFLRRYPTTTSNRERTRARFVYEKLLGVPVMKLAAFATPEIPEGESLENLTWDTQPCVVCHTMLDPVAATFNHFTNNGSGLRVRRPCRLGGMRPPSFGFIALPGEDVAGAGEVRYALDDASDCDVRNPNTGAGAGEVDARAPRRLDWLADRVVEHPRFAYGVVLPLYESLVGAPILSAPDNLEDPDFLAKSRAFATQQQELSGLVAAFRAGNGRLKPVVKAIVLGRSFRAASMGIVDDDKARALLLLGVGAGGLWTTPEVLDRKITALTGLRWAHLRNPNANSSLVDDNFYAIFAGGIDSESVTIRSRDPVAVRAAVARRLGNEVACVVVPQELAIVDATRRKLFTGVEPDTVDDASVRAQIRVLHQRLWNEEVVDEAEVDASLALFRDVRSALSGAGNNVPAPCQATSLFVRGERPAYPESGSAVVGGLERRRVVADPDRTVRAWMAVTSALLADGRFLFE